MRKAPTLAAQNSQGDASSLALVDEQRIEVATGASNAEIAGALFISEATVKTHLENIFTKLDLRDRAATIVFAHRQGLV